MSTPIYRQVQDLRLYSLDSGCPKQECWAGYLPGPDAQITAAIYPAATWNDPGGVYLFLKEAPADFSAFLGNLNLLLPKLSPTGEVRILWIYNPNRDSAYWQWDMLKAQAAQGVEGLDWTVARQALFNIGNYTVAIQPGAAMTLDEDFNCAIAFAVDQVSFLGPNGVYPAQGYSVSIPLWGTATGAFHLYLTLADDDLSKLAVMLRYATTAATSELNSFDEVETLDMPVLSLATGATMAMKLSFDPLNPLNPERSHLSFFPYDDTTPPALNSAFVTTLGIGAILTPAYIPEPLRPARLVFNRTPTTYAPGGESSDFAYHLTPDGAFTLTVADPPAGKTASHLLCGLSGVESIRFNQGDIMMFYSGQPAGIDVTAIPGSSDISLRLSESSPYTTAWAMILPGNAANPSVRTYYSEPDRSPFFIHKAGKHPSELKYYPISLITLPDTPSSNSTPYCFPIAPYRAMVQAAFGFSSKPQNVEAFEFQLLNPTRQNIIERMPQPSTSTASNASVYALTPQGYQATFVNGVWTGIRIAQMPSAQISIGFQSADSATPLPAPLQNAFLTNQQFLVITEASNLDKTFSADITMDGWPFTLDFAKNTAVGDYRNVLIFKSGNGTVRQMARQPELWTQYASFNNSTGDPDGTFLSNWLVNYLEDAITLYDGGNGVESLGQFCSLIDDPHWNGFLALKVDVQTRHLPLELEALLVGIDRSLFYAHHLGNRINHVKPVAGAAYQLNSSIFGLVHYMDPNLGAEANNLPAYISSPLDYRFKVLTLEAVFENAVLVHFSSKTMLLLNKLFGDTVQRTSADGNKQGANNLVLIGSYHDSDGVPSYTFQTAKGAATAFYPASDAFACNRITRANMVVTKTGAKPITTYLAQFNLMGNFEFLADPVFDLLSYQYLPYRGLSVKMKFSSAGDNPLYSFDSTGLILALNPSEVFDPAAVAPPNPTISLVRQGSLLAQFPLKLKSLVNGSADRLPKHKGYRHLETQFPSGISLPSPSGAWYALEFDMNLGGQGALGANNGLSASLLLAWMPGGSGYEANASPQFRLSGPDGVSLGFDLEGVIKFGAKDIVLNKIDSSGKNASPDEFILVFESIALTVLSLSFPPEGTTNIALFGDFSATAGSVVNPTLGWFGGYAEQSAAKGGG